MLRGALGAPVVGHMSTVVLHVYDLSQGMAKAMSPMLIGKTIGVASHDGVFQLHGTSIPCNGSLPVQMAFGTLGLWCTESTYMCHSL